jgi:hypothetical protein
LRSDTIGVKLAGKNRVGSSVRIRVADGLKEWVRNDLAPDLGASFAADLLGYALDQVDWFEIADAWIQSAKEAAEYAS